MSGEALLEFLAYSAQLEQEAAERYSELAEALATHRNGDVAAFFERMTKEAGEHLAEVERLTGGKPLPQIEPWEFTWPDVEPPETLSYEAVHYRMGLDQAIRLALGNERAAERFYRDYAQRSGDPEVRRLAGAFADEEATHAAALETLLQQAPPTRALQRIEDDDPVIPD